MGHDHKKQLWYLKSSEEIISKFETSLDKGLSSQKVEDLHQKYGRNVFKEEEKVNFWKIIIKEINSPLIYLLLGAALISVLTSHYTDAMVILLVISLNTALGVSQEWRAEKALEAIKHLGASKARVLRDGKEQKIETEKVLAEQENMVWMSTAVTAGHGKAVVVATGMDTVMGEIAGNVRDTNTGKELDIMTDEQLAEKVKTVRVFARVTPSHKLKILNSLKKNGQVVAMTGSLLFLQQVQSLLLMKYVKK